MCARLLACPLCSQPGFLTLDALRTGLVSVATRPLVCPVCNEVLLGIDKLTIHLFSHTINLSNNAAESSKHISVSVLNEHLVAMHNTHNVALQDWNTLKTQQLDKTQESNSNSKICTEPSSPMSIIGEKISVINPQPQVQSQDLSVKSTNQQTFMSDYNYDVIKVNILPQSNENYSEALKSSTSLQELVKTNCVTQISSNDNIKHLNLSQENTQIEKIITSDFPHNWIERQTCKSLSSKNGTESTNTNVYQTTGIECIELNNDQYITKEKSTVNLINKENNSDFQSIQDTIPVCANISSRENNEKQNVCNAKETVSGTNVEDQDENSQKYRKVLPYTQTKISQTIPSKEKPERCNICGFHFPDSNILALHRQLVHEQDSNNISGKILKNYSCHLCSKVFKMRGSLMVHMRVAHIGYNLGSLSKNGQVELTNSDAGYNCPTCGKKFKKEQHVIQHLKTHEGKQWECDTCSKMFTTKYFLKKHKRLHSGEMPYKCKICDKNFTFQQSYHKHRLYHKDDKPHTCATCGRSFKELSTLHNHERIHTGEKPFACETCGKCFRQRVSYLVHRRIHTGVMPYKCTMCDKSFRYKVSQRTHKCPVQTSETIQQPSDTIVQETNDKANRLQTTNILQESQPMTNVDNEENKFVLIINAQGQHVLALQSEINDTSSKKKEQDIEFETANNTNKNLKSKTWSTDDLNSIELEESTVKKVLSNDEKINLKNTNDLFSLVMSHLENSISSPTFEMEHLRVSSPKQKENSIDSYTNFSQMSDNTQMHILESNVQQNLTHNKDVSDSLQTINVESLKELLYGIDRK